jgi:NADH-quinone oxidoreductase subunit C
VGLSVQDGEQAIELLREQFPDATVAVGSYRSQHWAEVKADRLVEVCEWLRDDAATSFDFLVDVTAVHWPDDPQPMELIYHLFSYSRNDRLRLKVRVGDAGPVPTLCHLWRSADWNERETLDMFGIDFAGHPDPRRILMPDDYTDHPLRKEFPLYQG